MVPNKVQDQRTTDSLATSVTLVFRLTVSKGWSTKRGAPGNMLHNFLPDSFPLLVRHTRTQLLSLLLRYSLALVFLPHPSSRTQRNGTARLPGMPDVVFFLFSLQRYFISKLDSFYFDEGSTTKIKRSISEMSLWQTRHVATGLFVFCCSSRSRSSQNPLGGYKSSLSMLSSACMSHSCELT